MEREDQVTEVADMMELVASPELKAQVDGATGKVREAMYHLCSFQNVDFRKLVDKHTITHEESLLESVNLLLSDPL